jgi:hypothetical protein
MPTIAVRRATRWSLWLVSLLILGGLVCGSPEAWGTTVPFDARFAGTTVTTPFTFTGGPGFLLTVTGQSNQGSFDSQFVVEFTPTGNECELRNGDRGQESEFVGEVIVLTFEKSVDQLFLTLQRGTACQSIVNPAAFDGVTHLVVSGGTGQFAGASGTMTKTWSVTVLAVGLDPTSLLFGSFQGRYDGTIEVAE